MYFQESPDESTKPFLTAKTASSEDDEDDDFKSKTVGMNGLGCGMCKSFQRSCSHPPDMAPCHILSCSALRSPAEQIESFILSTKNERFAA
jgi:hypothetical protein